MVGFGNELNRGNVYYSTFRILRCESIADGKASQRGFVESLTCATRPDATFKVLML